MLTRNLTQGAVVIPMLPCSSVDETLAFYEALGFTVTYRQAKPNTYACVRHGSVELNFFVKRDWNPSFCYIQVEDVDALHEAFIDGAKRTYGRRLVRGTPRISSVNDLTSDRRFNVVDPGGNWLYIGQPYSAEALEQRKAQQQGADTRLGKALKGASLLAYSKVDAEAAAIYLDKALALEEKVPAPVWLQALVLRADIAVTLGHMDEARKRLAEARALLLSEDERASLNEPLGQMLELEQILNISR